MRISIEANSAVQEVLRDELWRELISKLPAEEFSIEELSKNMPLKKGIWEDIGIAVLSKLAAEIVGKVISAFTKKHRVKIIIQDSNEKKIVVSYQGEDYEKLEKFLLQCVS